MDERRFAPLVHDREAGRAKGLVVQQDVVDRGHEPEHDRDDRLLYAASRDQAAIGRGQSGALHLDGGMGRLDQAGPQPAVAVPGGL